MNEQLDQISKRADDAASSMARAFGSVGNSIGDATKLLVDYGKKQQDIDNAVSAGTLKQGAAQKQSADLQLNTLIGLTDAAKGLFKEHSAGYKAMADAEKALTILQLARTAVSVAAGAASMFASLGPLGFPAVVAMLGVMASLGFHGGAGISAGDYSKGDDGTGTTLGDTTAQSKSIANSIDKLKDINDATLTVSRDMLDSLRAIQSSIAGVSSLIVQGGDINASAGVTTGMQTSLLGKLLEPSTYLGPVGSLIEKIPVIGDIVGGISKLIGSLFGTKTSVIGSGIYGGAQSIGDILSSGFDAQSYSDIEKKHKFLGITTGTSYSTVYGDQIDDSITNQFALILKGFNDAIVAAAGPLGQSTSDISARVSNFVFSLGKIDLDGLTGDQIQDKLEAVFGAAGDAMAEAAIPGLEKFQQVGEGYLETLVRVASTVEQVDSVFQKLGETTGTMGVDVDMAIAGMFDSVSDFTDAANTYFSDFYTQSEQAAAKTAQLTKAFSSLGLTLPDSIDAYRQLVDAQDLTTSAGQQMYVTLLQLAPAFSDMVGTMQDAATAADILKEQQDLQNQLWQLTGDTADIRAAQLATLDPSNRALQEQIYAIQDAQDAANAAKDLADAWTQVGDSIMDEINRIRGLTDASTGGSFASLLGQFNAANAAARAGDQDAAKNLPTLSQSLLDAAADAATSRQELDRIQAQTAASLQATYDAITAMADGGISPTTSTSDQLDSLTASQATAATNDNVLTELQALRAELVQMHADANSGMATVAGNTGAIKKTLDNVTADSGGTAISTVAAAA